MNREITKYTFNTKTTGDVLFSEPTNWRESERELKRNKVWHGVFSKLSKALSFSGRSRDVLIDLFFNRGTEHEAKLTRKDVMLDTLNEDWEIVEDGYLNPMTFSDDEHAKVCQCEFDEEPSILKLNNGKNQEIDIFKEQTLNGKNIDPMPTETLSVEFGKKIFLRSDIIIRSGFEDVDYGEEMSSFFGGTERFAPYINVKNNSDKENIQSTIFPSPFILGVVGGSGRTIYRPDLSQYFYFNSNRERTIRIKIKTKVFFNGLFIDDAYRFRFSLLRSIYNEETGVHDDINIGNSDEVQDIYVYETPSSPPPSSSIKEVDVNFEVDIDVKHHESLCFTAGVTHLGSTGFDFTLENFSMTIEEDSEFRETTNKVVSLYEKGRRLVRMITDDTVKFKSNLLTTGEGKYWMACTGFMIRNFSLTEDSNTEDEIFTQRGFNTTFDKYFNEINAILPIAIWVETIGFDKYIRLEKAEEAYLTKSYTGIGTYDGDDFSLTKVNVVRSIDEEYIYSTVKIGSTKGGGQYEESNSLDEYNGLATMNLPITGTDNTYDVTTETRFDGTGFEFCRRFQKEDYPDRDTRYDQDSWVLDCKKVGAIYQLNQGADTFSQLPEGVYSPETAINLNFSLVRCALRHSKFFNTGSYYNKDGYMTISANSYVNGALTTKKSGENAIREKDSINIFHETNTSLSKPLFLAIRLEFTAPLDVRIRRELYGSTLDEGVLIPNIQGRIATLTGRGEEYVYIDSIKEGENLLTIKARLATL